MPFYFPWFHAIEQSALAVWLRESPSPLAFPNVLFLHTLGMSVLAGTSAAVSLRILGFGCGMRLAPMTRFMPLLWSACWVTAVTGALLLAAYPTKAFTNPVFYVKLGFVALALRATRSIETHVLRDPRADAADVPDMPARWTRLAALSLALWAGAITSGKLMAHTYTRLFSY